MCYFQIRYADIKKETTTIAIDQNGTIYLNKEKVTQKSLSHALSTLNNQEVTIKAHKAALHEWVVEVLDIVRKNKINKVSIATKISE